MTRAHALAALAAASLATLSLAQEIEADHRGVTIGDDDTNLTIGGRIHFDLATFNEGASTTFKDDAGFRRVRVDATLTVNEDWRFKVDADVGGQNTGIRNLWAMYRGIDNVTIKAGNFIAPLAGENMMSSNNLKLMERSLASRLAPNFLLGIGATYRGENVSVSAGYFGDPLKQNPTRPADSGESVTARVVWAPIRKRREVLHLALGAERRDLDAGALSRVSVRPEFGLNGETLVNSGRLTGIESYTNVNVEAAYMRGPFLVKASTIARRNEAPSLGDPTFYGGSIEAAYVLTGERQRYGLTNGTFGGIRPKGKIGAVEVAARFSFVDLNDGVVTGGRQENWSIGVNWYQTRNTRIMVNYVNASTSPGANGQRENVGALMARFQVSF